MNRISASISGTPAGVYAAALSAWFAALPLCRAQLPKNIVFECHSPIFACSALMFTGGSLFAQFFDSNASGVQLRRRRANRLSAVSPSKSVVASTSSDLATLSKVFTFTTAYREPSIRHVTIGITPHVLQTWKSAVFVPNRYWVVWHSSAISKLNRPFGCDVQMPLCFLQWLQLHARTRIVGPENGQSNVKRMFPQ